MQMGVGDIGPTSPDSKLYEDTLMIVYVIHGNLSYFRVDSGIVGIYRTLEGAQKAKAQLKLGAPHLCFDIVDYEVQD